MVAIEIFAVPRSGLRVARPRPAKPAASIEELYFHRMSMLVRQGHNGQHDWHVYRWLCRRARQQKRAQMLQKRRARSMWIKIFARTVTGALVILILVAIQPQ